jgi:hypothetical protein
MWLRRLGSGRANPIFGSNFDNSGSPKMRLILPWYQLIGLSTATAIGRAAAAAARATHKVEIASLFAAQPSSFPLTFARGLFCGLLHFLSWRRRRRSPDILINLWLRQKVKFQPRGQRAKGLQFEDIFFGKEFCHKNVPSWQR